MSMQANVPQFITQQNSPNSLNLLPQTQCQDQSTSVPQPQSQPELSMLLHLQQSLNQRPTFEQVFVLQQEKKHLWQLLALKEETVQKLQKKVKQCESKLQQINNQLTRKQQIILEMKRRQKELEKEVKKVMQIKNNIVDQFNYLKEHFVKERKQQQTNHQQISRPILQNKTQKTIYLDTNHNLLSAQQLSLLKNQNIQLALQNTNLKNSLDSLLAELSLLKLQVFENFYLVRHSGKQCQQNGNGLNIYLDQKYSFPKGKQSSDHNRGHKISSFDLSSVGKKVKDKQSIVSAKQLKQMDKIHFPVQNDKGLRTKSKYTANKAPLSNNSTHNKSFRASVSRKQNSILRQLPIR